MQNWFRKAMALKMIQMHTKQTTFSLFRQRHVGVKLQRQPTPEIGTILDKAMIAIEADNKSLKGVLPKNYANPELDKRVLGNVVDVFTNMDMSDTEASKDRVRRWTKTEGRISTPAFCFICSS